MGAAEARGEAYVQLARALDRPEQYRPAPRPTPQARRARCAPMRLSVTRIETLRRDPYAVFAEAILRLKPLEPIGVATGPREVGNLWHAALQEFSEGFASGPLPADARARLLAIARARFAADARRSVVPRHALAAHRPRLRQVSRASTPIGASSPSASSSRTAAGWKSPSPTDPSSRSPRAPTASSCCAAAGRR